MSVLRKLWDHLEEYLLVWSLAFSVALIFFQVVMRYVFRNSLSWSEELARYLFLWQIWLGASFAVKEHRHLRIEMLRDAFKGRAQRWFDLAVLLVWFGFSLFLALEGSELTRMLIQRGQVSAAMRLPMAYAYASVPVGCGLMAIRLLGEMAGLLRSLKGEAA
jgi:TRAP-type C4-dicarboxylate transport system permease small subunit